MVLEGACDRRVPWNSTSGIAEDRRIHVSFSTAFPGFSKADQHIQIEVPAPTAVLNRLKPR